MQILFYADPLRHEPSQPDDQSAYELFIIFIIYDSYQKDINLAESSHKDQ